MFIALIGIFLFFGIRTNGLFLSPRNISDLVNQTGYVAVLAMGMTLILIIRHIDLSVGYVAGFLGAVAAILLRDGWPVYSVIPVVLLLGMAIGLYQGFLVAKVGVPAFVTTLAGMFMFRGLLSLITAGSGTIIVRNEAFKAVSNGFIPDIPNSSGIHLLTMIIGALLAVLMVTSQFRSRKTAISYQFEVSSSTLFILKNLILSIAILGVAFVLAKYKGIPWTILIVSVVLFLYYYLLNKTSLGRYIYGIGGNAEAAELSGVNVQNVTLFCFASVSLMAALGGILYTSRLASAAPQAGLGFEMDAIASSYIGGVSVSGGVGKVTNTIIGSLVIMSLTNGMNLMGIDISYQYIVKGIIFILAVAFDVKTKKQA
jgi:putative multiple sugar transport system permease protein